MIYISLGFFLISIIYLFNIFVYRAEIEKLKWNLKWAEYNCPDKLNVLEEAMRTLREINDGSFSMSSHAADKMRKYLKEYEEIKQKCKEENKWKLLIGLI